MTIIFKEEDFISHQNLFFTFSNETSGTFSAALNVNRIQEFLQDGVRIKALNKSCAIGHSIQIYFFDEMAKRRISFSEAKSREKYSKFVALGKIIEKENTKNKSVSIIVKFSQFDTDQWQRIIEENRELQIKLSDDLKRLKAHE